MKVCLFGLQGIPLGKHNVKDPRLDEVDRLVEAKKKTYVQVDVVDESEAATAAVLLVTPDSRPDLLLRDLEFVENRLSRAPADAERAALLKLKQALEQDRTAADAGLTPQDWQALAAHSGFLTAKPIVVATPDEQAHPDKLILRAYGASGHICFLTVGGKENRAWMIRQGATAWEAAGVIHSDIQRSFIRAEVIAYSDLLACGGETAAKRAGKQRLEGRSYVMQDCDVVNFRFGK